MIDARITRLRGSAGPALLAFAIGCGASAPAATESPAASAPSSGGEPGAVASARLVVGAVAWELSQTTRIDESGTVSHGSSRVGRLTEDGVLTGRHGEVAARLDEAGWVALEERRSPLRIVGDTVVEVRDPDSNGGGAAPMMRIEGRELVVGSGDEEERIELIGFRPELAREVLFVSAVVMLEMARGFSH